MTSREIKVGWTVCDEMYLADYYRNILTFHLVGKSPQSLTLFDTFLNNVGSKYNVLDILKH